MFIATNVRQRRSFQNNTSPADHDDEVTGGNIYEPEENIFKF